MQPSYHLCSRFCSYPVKARQAPSGTYDAIARTLADYPSNINHINEKKWQEARDRGGWIDIHDYDPAAPDEYDVIIRDVDGGKLRTEISEALSIPYLGKATEGDASKVVKYIDGHLYGYKHRPILPCVVHTHNGDEAHWVFFILDTAAPATYLSPQVSSHLPIKVCEMLTCCRCLMCSTSEMIFLLLSTLLDISTESTRHLQIHTFLRSVSLGPTSAMLIRFPLGSLVTIRWNVSLGGCWNRIKEIKGFAL